MIKKIKEINAFRKLFSFGSSSFSVLLALVFSGIFCTGVYVYAVYGIDEPFPLGNTINPTCAPGSSENCTVTPPASYSFSGNSFSGSGEFHIKSNSSKLYFGPNDNASMYFNGSNLIINPNSAGNILTIGAGAQDSYRLKFDTANKDGIISWNNADTDHYFAFNDNVDLVQYDLTTTGTVTAGTVAVGTAYTLPTTDGSSGQVLSTDGSGTLSWTTVSANDTDWTWDGTLYNTIGATAGNGTMTGANNFFVGNGAGTNNATGYDNNFLGTAAGYYNTTGNDNNFLGLYAGYYNAAGNNNNFLGYSAGYSNTEGSSNNFLGLYAGYSNSTGTNNTFIGTYAGYYQTGPNILIIDSTDSGRGSAEAEVANALIYGVFGSSADYQTLRINGGLILANLASDPSSPTPTTGEMYYNTSNNVIRYYSNSGWADLTGGGGDTSWTWDNMNYNMMGSGAGNNTMTGQNNFFVGNNAGYGNTGGSDNNFLGAVAGYNNSTGHDNNFFGNSAGYNNSTGFNNNFLGVNAGLSNTTGNNNNFLGYSAGYANNTGTDNNFLGYYAGYNNTTGSSNDFMGPYAGYNNTTGYNNNFFGDHAGYYNTDGSDDVFIGTYAGYYQTGSNILIIDSTPSGRGNESAERTNSLLFGIFSASGADYQTLRVNGGLILANLASDPTSPTPTTGEMYYNTSSNVIRYYGNSGWADLAGGGGGDTTFSSGNAQQAVYMNGYSLYDKNGNEITAGGGGGGSLSGNAAGDIYMNGYILYDTYGNPIYAGESGALSGFAVGYINMNNYTLTFPANSTIIDGVSDTVSIKPSARILQTSGSVDMIDWSGSQNTSAALSFDATSVYLGSGYTLKDSSGNPISGGGDTTFSSGNAQQAVYMNGYSLYDKNGNEITAGGGGGSLSGNAAGDIYMNGYSLYDKNGNEITAGGGGGAISLAGTDNYYSTNSGNGSSGTNNFFVGNNAGYSNTSGYSNNFIGYYAGYSNTTGYYNNFLGYVAGYSNTSGYSNNFLGYYAGYSNTSGYGNNFLGNNAGYYNTTGYANNFFGYSAGQNNTSGDANNFIGYSAGLSNTTGSGNNFLGRMAGYSNYTGSDNNFIGRGAGLGNYSGGGNNFIGHQAGYSNNSGSNDIFIGYKAGHSSTSGDNNVFIGANAGYHQTGSSDLLIIDSTVSGRPGPIVERTQSLVFGQFNATASSQLFRINGQVEMPLLETGDYTTLTIDSNGKLYKSSSSLRYKTDVNPLEEDFSKILEAIPVSFRYKGSDILSIGYIAEDLDELGLKNLVIYDNAGKPDAIRYDKISLYLAEIIKQQQLDIDALKISAGLSNTGSVGSGSVSGVNATNSVTQSILDLLNGVGITIQNGVTSITKLAVSELISQKAKIETAEINQLQMNDKVTGQAYCVWVENGTIKTALGNCESPSVAPVQENQPAEQPQQAETTDSSATGELATAKEISSVSGISDITVNFGSDKTTINLPSTVSVILSDSSTVDVAVSWDEGTPSFDSNASGEYVFSGTLTLPAETTNPNELKASVKVIVSPQPTNIIDAVENATSSLMNGFYNFFSRVLKIPLKNLFSWDVIKNMSASIFNSIEAIKSHFPIINLK